MRKLTFGAANSLDNRIAREDHAVDWLRWSPEVAAIMGAFWKTIDAVVMGRKTFEAAFRQGQGAYPGVANYVVGRRLPPGAQGVELVTGDPVPFVRELKHRRGKGICLMGGGVLARSLFEADLIDEVGVNIHPVLLGSGVPMFHDHSRQIDLELAEHRILENGCVYLLYRVKR